MAFVVCSLTTEAMGVCESCIKFDKEPYKGSWSLKHDVNESMICIDACEYQSSGSERTICRSPPGESGDFSYSTCGEYFTTPTTSTASLVVTGGYTGSGFDNSVDVYIPPHGTGCDSLPPLDTPRSYHLLLNIGDSIIACGGYTTSYTDTCMELDKAGNTWTSHSSMTTNYRYLASSAIINNKQCILGGVSGARSTIECLEGTMWELLSGETIPGGGVYASCAANIGGAGIIIVGGANARKQVISRSENGTWDTTSWTELPEPRYGHSCSLIAAGSKLLVAGGYVNSAYSVSVRIVDPETKGNSPGGDMTTARGFFAMGKLDEGLFALGGTNNDGYLNSVEAYDEENKQWTKIDEFTLKVARVNMGYAVVPAAILGC